MTRRQVRDALWSLRLYYRMTRIFDRKDTLTLPDWVAERMEQVEEIVAEARSVLRTVYELRYRQGKTLREIAEIMEMTEGYLKKLHRELIDFIGKRMPQKDTG